MNVIVIVMDSLRADHVGCYGSQVRTPNIDRVAADAALFTQAYSESVPTMPTRTTWWTGRTTFPFRYWQPFELDDVLLAEVLWDRGYTSALVTDTYHLHKPRYNCGRGFDTTVFVRGQEADPWIIDESIPVDLSRHRFRGDDRDEWWRRVFEQYLRNTSGFTVEEDYFAPRVATEAIRWLDRQVVTGGRGDRLFLWVDFFDPHEPWDPPEPWRSMYDPEYGGQELIDPVPGDVDGYMTPRELQHTMALYAGEVTFVDKWVGQLVRHIQTLGLWDNTLLMLTSDHGEPFGEHGYVRKARPYSYEELVHIPWIVRHPRGIGAGRRIGALVQTTDLMPTVLDALEIDTPICQNPGRPGVEGSDHPVELHGSSLIPLMRGDVETIREFAFSGHHVGQWAIRDRDWTFLMPLDDTTSRQLYCRRDDPGERRNIIADVPAKADELELALRRHVDNLEQR